MDKLDEREVGLIAERAYVASISAQAIVDRATVLGWTDWVELAAPVARAAAYAGDAVKENSRRRNNWTFVQAAQKAADDVRALRSLWAEAAPSAL